MRTVLVLGGLLAVGLGCADSTPTTRPGTQARQGRPPSAPPRAAEARRSPLEAVPVGPAVLSVFEPTGGSCQWRRLDALSGQAAPVADFPVDRCVGARVAWNPDGSSALVWFDASVVQRAGVFSPNLPASPYPDEKQGEGVRAFQVTLASGATKALPPFPKTTVEKLGLGPGGAVLVLGTERLPEDAVAKGSVVVDGKTLKLEPVSEGLPALAHAWRLDGARWKRVESAQTTTGWDYAQGAQALHAAESLGPTSEALLDALPRGTADDPLGEALSAALAKLAPKDEGEWRALGTSPHRALVWTMSAEIAQTTGLVAFEGAPTVAVKNGLNAGTLAAHRVNGRYLLSSMDGAGTHARLYDLERGGPARWSSDTARAVTFWP